MGTISERTMEQFKKQNYSLYFLLKKACTFSEILCLAARGYCGDQKEQWFQNKIRQGHVTQGHFVLLLGHIRHNNLMQLPTRHQ